jgi:hypothetical protein
MLAAWALGSFATAADRAGLSPQPGELSEVMEARLRARGFSPLKQFLRAHLWLHEHTTWPTISPFAVAYTPPSSKPPLVAPRPQHPPLHPRQPVHFVPGAADAVRDSVQRTAQPDPVATQDPFMCQRWLDPERLPERYVYSLP